MKFSTLITPFLSISVVLATGEHKDGWDKTKTVTATVTVKDHICKPLYTLTKIDVVTQYKPEPPITSYKTVTKYKTATVTKTATRTITKAPYPTHKNPGHGSGGYDDDYDIGVGLDSKHGKTYEA
ncbi:hypothetical protein ACHAPJ_012707 [Fusarium lateritium]